MSGVSGDYLNHTVKLVACTNESATNYTTAKQMVIFTSSASAQNMKKIKPTVNSVPEGRTKICMESYFMELRNLFT